MFGYDSIAGARPIGGDRRPRPYGTTYTGAPMMGGYGGQEQQSYGGFTNRQIDNYERRYGAPQYKPPDAGPFYGGYSNRQLDNYERRYGGAAPVAAQTQRAMPSMSGGTPRFNLGAAQAAPQLPNFLANRLADTTDPGELGALRARISPPWMGGQTQQIGGGNQALAQMLGFDTTGTAPATDAARLARQSASPNRLNYTQQGNVGNYSMTPGEDGIDAGAIVRQNPSVIYGFSPRHQQQLAMDPNYQADLKQRQMAYRQRQMAYRQRQLAEAAIRQGNVQQQAMARGNARDERLAARKAGPSQMDMLFQQNPQLAIQAMHMQNQNQMLAAQLGIENRKADQGDRRLTQEQALANANLDATERGRVMQFMSNWQGDPEEGMAMAMSLMGKNGQQGADGGAGSRRPPSKKDETALLAMTDPTERRNYMRDIMKLSPAEITARLQADYRPSIANSLFGLTFGGQRGAPNATFPEGPMVTPPGYEPGIASGMMNWLFPPAPIPKRDPRLTESELKKRSPYVP